MTADNKHRFQGFALAILGTILFGTKGIVMKLAFEVGGTVDQMLALRMGFSLPVYLFIGWQTARSKSLTGSSRSIIFACLLGVLSYHICSWLDFQGLRYISAQLDRLIMFVYPTFVAIFAFFFLGDRFSLRHVAALILSYLGIIVLFGREFSHQGPDAMKGSLLVLTAAILFAVYFTASKPIIGRLGSALFTSIAMATACVTILIQFTAVSTFEGFPRFSPVILGYGLLLAVMCTILPSFMLSEAIGRLGPGPTSAVGNVGPVATSILAVFILGESFGWPHLVALILTSIGIGLLSSTKKQNAPPTGRLHDQAKAETG